MSGSVIMDHYASAGQMLAGLAARRIGAVELLELHLAREARTHAAVNAVVRQDVERARAEARAIDEARARGETLGPLAGLPMTVKDAFDIGGMPAHSGNPALAGRAPDCPDAPAVARLRSAGAVIWGKTNVPFRLEEWQSFNALYGTTNNPYDAARSPGGSSGGSAAALASGATPLELGSDIGGSLRVPAHYCGVMSCKPTWGLLPQDGHIFRAPGLDQNVDLNVVGPMARSAADLQLLLDVLCHKPPRLTLDPVQGLRAVLWTEASGFALGGEARSAAERAGAALADAGVAVAPGTPPFAPEELLVTYRDLLIPIVTEGATDLPPMPLIRALWPVFALRRALGQGPISMAGYALGLTASQRKRRRAAQRRDAMKHAMAQFFESADLIVAPVTGGEAFPHNHEGKLIDRTLTIDGRTVPMISNLEWIALATTLHLPAVVVPAGRSTSGLPLGAQLIGPWGSEDRLIGAAAAIEARLGGFSPPDPAV